MFDESDIKVGSIFRNARQEWCLFIVELKDDGAGGHYGAYPRYVIIWDDGRKSSIYDSYSVYAIVRAVNECYWEHIC